MAKNAAGGLERATMKVGPVAVTNLLVPFLSGAMVDKLVTWLSACQWKLQAAAEG
jgi:hypothetical protein